MTEHRERVDALLHSRLIGVRYAVRVSNQTIKLRANRVPDSDVMLEDRNGYRYARSTYPAPADWLYFEMI